MALTSEQFALPSGETVELRQLSGFETLLSRKKYPDDSIKFNAFALSCAMGVTEGAALEWMQEHSAGDFVAVTDRIQELSGLGEGAGKSGVSTVRD